MRVIAGTRESLPPKLITQLARYRHRVFVEKLGWQLRSENGLEFDQFDRPDTFYVIAKNGAGQIIGSARLLPTTRPYLLGEIFPQLLNGDPVPHSTDVWELSRFAAVNFHVPTGGASGQFSSPIATGLLQAAMECAGAHGSDRLITVSPLGVERLLCRAGFRPHRAGPPMVLDGHSLFACWIERSVPLAACCA